MKQSNIKKPPQSRASERVFLPHSSWTRPVAPGTTPKRLPPEEFWERLGL